MADNDGPGETVCAAPGARVSRRQVQSDPRSERADLDDAQAQVDRGGGEPDRLAADGLRAERSLTSTFLHRLRDLLCGV